MSKECLQIVGVDTSADRLSGESREGDAIPFEVDPEEFASGFDWCKRMLTLIAIPERLDCSALESKPKVVECDSSKFGADIENTVGVPIRAEALLTDDLKRLDRRDEYLGLYLCQ